VDAPNVLVVGDVAWDIFIRPEHELVRGSDVLGTVDVLPGGAAANVAVWARRLGARVVFRCKLGDDTLGRLMQAHLNTEGAGGHVISVPGGLSTRVGILIAADGEHSFVIDHTKVLRFEAGDLPLSLLDGIDAVFFNGYDIFLAGSAAFLTPLVAEARRRGIALAFDPSSFALIRAYGGSRLLDEIGSVDVLLANEDEARVLSPNGQLAGLARFAALVVVKEGTRGAAAYDGRTWIRSAAVPVSAVDTTGAGDAFDAAFLVTYLARRDIQAALEAGNRLGAHVASHLGAQPPSPEATT
jgi:sugar/nucleoside kinase (ribokinase family)